MLELGKSGSDGVGKGVVPVLDGKAVVATLRSSSWKESATALVGDRAWVFGKQRRELVARWADDPVDTVRLRARQMSAWRGTWALELDGVAVERARASRWRGPYRYTVAGRLVAESGTTGGWQPRGTLDAAAEVPLASQVFLLWFESVLTRRDTAIAIGVGGAVVAGGAS